MLSKKTVERKAFAKVNLTLEVFGTRDDGYHTLRSVVQQISLCDTVTVEEAGTFSSDSGFSDDLSVKAAKALATAADVRKGAAIKTVKRIPVGGGLGGGSADAAATLLALNDLWRLGWSRERLASVAVDVGSDVPALVLGGTVLMEGRGEKVSPLFPRDAPIKPFHLVLANPGVFCSTKDVYAKCTSRLQETPSILYNMRSALECGDTGAVAEAMVNDLQKPAVALHEEIAQALEALDDAGAEGVMMSGSGSTVFGLVRDEARGSEIAAALKEQGFWAECVHTVVR